MSSDNVPAKVWFDGRIVPFEDARVHVLSSAVRYGTTVFEGYCAYRQGETGRLNLFRAGEHHRRLQDSARLLRMDVELRPAELSDIIARVIAENGFSGDLHIRLSAHLVGDYLGSFGARGPTILSCVAIPRNETPPAKRAVRAQVSSWRRIGDEAMPPRIKAAANYQNSRLGVMQARADGYQETIFLDPAGKVSEASASTLFMRRNGAWITPPPTGGILESITRDSLLTLLRLKGEAAVERLIDRTELYVADEIFLCGSAAEITPVVDVDGHRIGSGETGVATQALWVDFMAVARATVDAPTGWQSELLA
ncbi:MAG: aminotransferase class IV [Rhizobiaceae bacterium]